jgi:hypothetical protein
MTTLQKGEKVMSDKKTPIKKASEMKKEREHYHGTVIGKDTGSSGTCVILKDEKGSHSFMLNEGKVEEYGKDISVGDTLTVDAEEGIIVWIPKWEKKGQGGVMVNTLAVKAGEEVASKMTPPQTPYPKPVPSGPKPFHSYKDNPRIGWYAMLNTATTIIMGSRDAEKRNGAENLQLIYALAEDMDTFIKEKLGE